jgi:hypothetical protein
MLLAQLQQPIINLVLQVQFNGKVQIATGVLNEVVAAIYNDGNFTSILILK